MKYILWIALVLVGVGFVFKEDLAQYLVAGTTTGSEEESDKKDKKKGSKQKPSEVSIVKKWELPEVLREVSGIAYLDEQRFATVQDEEGTIFIYNHAAGKIEKEISFAGPGDYEDITVKNNTAFIVRADGRLYEVPLQGNKKDVKEHNTPLTVAHNVEGLFYDEENNRLLIAIKDDEPHTKEYKGIYAFNLQTNTFVEEPVYKIGMNDELLKGDGKKAKKFRPSALAIHPQTKELYVLDGPSARLLLMQDGKAKKVYQLGPQFPQAEGITFSPSGELYISNEGKKQGNIIHTKLP